jgi:hypothetical protein
MIAFRHSTLNPALVISVTPELIGVSIRCNIVLAKKIDLAASPRGGAISFSETVPPNTFIAIGGSSRAASIVPAATRESSVARNGRFHGEGSRP